MVLRSWLVVLEASFVQAVLHSSKAQGGWSSDRVCDLHSRLKGAIRVIYRVYNYSY